ncbi:MAG: hypothetical protein KatS3mg015_0916 [Fimbriimonadales bacterium]|nr:MAG: hypothetical protein KatS3mg015_0916 [Fimbriimonadales bacterium]
MVVTSSCATQKWTEPAAKAAKSADIHRPPIRTPQLCLYGPNAWLGNLNVSMKGPFANLLSNLISQSASPCLSVYMATHPASAQAAEDRIRLKNLLKDAEARLGDSADWLDGPRQLLEDEEFWTHLSNSLLLFASPDGFEVVRTPLPFAEDQALCSRYCLKQLIGYADHPERIHLVAVSSKHVRLFECSTSDITEVPIPDTVQVASEFLGSDDREEEFQQHSVHARSGGTIFHGQGAGRDEEDEHRLRFFQHVARGLERALGANGSPVVLLGTQENLAQFRSAYKAPKDLIEVQGSGDHANLHDLNRSAWDAVFARSQADREKALAQFKELEGSEAGIHDPVAIVQAASTGRVRALFVAPDAHVWGSADLEQHSFDVADEWSVNAVDLLDLAAVLTAKHGGAVHCVPRDQLGALAGALLFA